METIGAVTFVEKRDDSNKIADYFMMFTYLTEDKQNIYYSLRKLTNLNKSLIQFKFENKYASNIICCHHSYN